MWPGAKHLRLLFTSSAALWIHASLADDTPFDCLQIVEADGFKFNLTNLAGEHSINQTRKTPPTEMVDSLRFNLCADLVKSEDVADKDQVSPVFYLPHCVNLNLHIIFGRVSVRMEREHA